MSISFLAPHDLPTKLSGVPVCAPRTGPPVSAFLTSDLARQWYKGKKVHYASIHDFLQRQQKRNEKLIYLTGHSLGGGIANLLGAEFGIPSIAFSPPGVRKPAILLDINPVRLQALAVDVIPDRDPVVRTGDHGTVQLPIACADHWPMCHRIFNSVCELFDTCGDQAQPPRALPCDFCPAKLRQRPRLAPHCGHPTGRDRTWNGRSTQSSLGRCHRRVGATHAASPAGGQSDLRGEQGQTPCLHGGRRHRCSSVNL
eukprot:g19550.t1